VINRLKIAIDFGTA